MQGPGQPGGDGVPGSPDLAQPHHDDRRPDRRERPAPPGSLQEGGPRAGARGPEDGGDAEPGGPARCLRPRALGGPAPTGDDRHGSRLHPEAPDRGRAHDGARRHHSGSDPGPPRPSPPGPGHVGRPHHARHGRDRRTGRPRARDVRREDRRRRHDDRSLHPHAASVLRGAPGLGGQAGPGPVGATGQHRRVAAGSLPADDPLSLRRPLPLRPARLSRERARAAAGCGQRDGPPGPLLSPGRCRPADHRQPSRCGGDGRGSERQGGRGGAGPRADPRRVAERGSRAGRDRPCRQGVRGHFRSAGAAQDRHGQGRLRRVPHHPAWRDLRPGR